MPFVTQPHRESPDPSIPGDLCYQYYKLMVDLWKASPRWTTAHNIYLNMRLETNVPPLSMEYEKKAAYELAWQVFFQKYVMPYEDKKEAENGTI